MNRVLKCDACGKFTSLLVPVPCNPPHEGFSREVCESCAGPVFGG